MSALLLSTLFLVLAALFLLVAGLRRRAIEKSVIVRMGGHANPATSLINDRNRSLFKGKVDAEAGSLLNKLGWRRQGLRNLFIASQVLAPVVAVLGTWLFYSVEGNQMPLLAGAAAAGLGFLAPKRILIMAVARRQRRIAVDVSTMLPLLRMFFEVGMTVEQALRVLSGEGEHVAPDIARELRYILARIDAGLDLGEELRTMARLLDVDELTECVGILEQLLRQGGGALASLANLKVLLDERRATTLQENVSKMSAKVSAVMVLFLLPALLIVLAGPGFIGIIGALGGG